MNIGIRLSISLPFVFEKHYLLISGLDRMYSIDVLTIYLAAKCYIRLRCAHNVLCGTLVRSRCVASSESDHLLIWHDSHPSNDLDQRAECWDKRCAVMKQIKVILLSGLGELVRQTDGVLRHILTTYIVCEDNRNTTYLPRMERGKDDERII